MAEPFKNEKQLKKFLMDKCKIAVKNTQNIAYQDVLQQANKFYGSYPDPVMYKRTWQLNNDNGKTEKFIYRSEITETANTCEADVHLDVDSLEYVTGERPTGEQVMAAAIKGYHGAIGDIPNSDKEYRYVIVSGGEKIWDEGLQAKAKDDLVKELIAQGIPIKKG